MPTNFLSEHPTDTVRVNYYIVYVISAYSKL